MNELMSPTAFKWFISILTAGLAGVWLIYDARNLIVTRNLDRSDAIVRDKHFGFLMGMVIGVIGLYGTLRFHDVL